HGHVASERRHKNKKRPANQRRAGAPRRANRRFLKSGFVHRSSLFAEIEIGSFSRIVFRPDSESRFSRRRFQEAAKVANRRHSARTDHANSNGLASLPRALVRPGPRLRQPAHGFRYHRQRRKNDPRRSREIPSILVQAES